MYHQKVISKLASCQPLTKTEGSESVSQVNGSADSDPEPIPKCHGSTTPITTIPGYHTVLRQRWENIFEG